VPLVSSFWLNAARYSGRVDFAALQRRAGPGASLAALDVPGLAALGMPLPVAVALAGSPPVELDDGVLTLDDPRYPDALRALRGAPPVLYTRGDVGLLGRPGVAIVGARRCTSVGRAQAARLARAVVQAGGVVVSGLAWGIDSAAHEAAQGATVAVLGQGLGVRLGGTQGRQEQALLAGGGVVLSEFPPGQPPARWTFPQRNRVIAGLSRVVVVVEAGVGSGSLITARWAGELGRDVLAVPGGPDAEASQGCLDLIDAGARIVRGPQTVIEAAGLGAGPPRDPLAARLLEALRDTPDTDRLLARCGVPLVELERLLAGLELTGVVERLPGDRYRSRLSEGCPTPP
jgi:DNA processing protein